MADNEATSAQHSQSRAFYSSAGGTIVALVFAISGFLYGINRTIVLQDVPKLILILSYASLIFVYLYCRYAALEGPIPNAEQLRRWVKFLPRLLAIGLAIWLLVIFPVALFLIPRTDWVAFISPQIFSLCPFAYLGVRMYLNVRKGGKYIDQERMFKNKVLLPAFATCLVSFTFGWTLVNPAIPFAQVVFPSLLIIAGREILNARIIIHGREYLRGRRWPGAVIFISATIIAASFLRMNGNAGIGTEILIGTVLTLAMGVAEICRRTVRINQGRPDICVLAPPEDAKFYLAGANWSSATFPQFLFLLPLLIPRVPVSLVFAIAATQILHWHFFDPEKKSEWVAWTNIALAFSSPVIFAIHPFMPTTNVFGFVAQIKLAPLFGTLYYFLGLYVTVLSILQGEMVRNFSRSLWESDAYRDGDNTFLLFVSINIFFFLFTASIALINDTGSQYFQPKAKETIIALVVLLVLATILKVMKEGRQSAKTATLG